MRYLEEAHKIIEIIGPGLMTPRQYEALERKITDSLCHFEMMVHRDGYDKAEVDFRRKVTRVFEKLFLEDNDLVTRVDHLEADTHNHDEDYGR